MHFEIQYDEYSDIVYFFENFFLLCIKTPPFEPVGFCFEMVLPQLPASLLTSISC